MKHSPTFDVFPCPFCRSAHVTLIGGVRSFVHYRCTDCEEVWTAMRASARREGNSPTPIVALVSTSKTRYH
jgi:transposase-like protein